MAPKTFFGLNKINYPKKSSLTSRKIKNKLDKLQIRSKKLPTKTMSNKKSQIPKIYSYLFSLSLLLSTSLSQLDDDSLQKYWLKLESFLKHDVYYDIDGLDLFLELKVLKEILQIKEYTLIDILNYIKMLDSFPNTCITYRILITIPVTVASARRSFFKIKINKIISKIDNVSRKFK